MNKFLLMLMIPILSIGLINCKDKDDVKLMDLKLLDGVWEVVHPGNQNVFEIYSYLDIKTFPDLINVTYGGYQGNITPFYITATGNQLHDVEYSWSIRQMENYQPLLDIVFQGELDDDDNIWKGNYFYKITNLTATDMWWQVRTNGDNSIIKFRRRPDIALNK